MMLLRSKLMCLGCCLAVALWGCQSKPEIPRYKPEGAPQTSAAKNDKAGASPYQFSEFSLEDPWDSGALRFHRQDVVKLSVWGHPELDHVAEVQANGKATFPLVGEIELANRTAEDVRAEIGGKLKHLSHPTSPKLRFGDVVKLFVWQHPELAFSAVVQPDGTVTLPLIGTLHVTELPLPALNREINGRLAQHIENPQAWLIPEVQARKVIYDPVVSVLPVKLSERRVVVVGEVFIQGQQSLRSGMRILDLLANARIKEEAELNSVIIIRNPESSTPQYRRLSLQDYLDGKAPLHNIHLREDDVIVVPKTMIAQAGYFVDVFFTRTKPIFDWYLAGQTALNYNSDRKFTRSISEKSIDINEAYLEYIKSLDTTTVPPAPDL